MGMQKFRASPLPQPTPEYSPEQQRQLIRVIERYFNLLDSDAAINVQDVFINGNSLEVETRRYTLLMGC